MPKRAARGSGHIRERKDKNGNPTGKWESQYTAGRHPGTGKQIRKSIYGNSQDDVRRKLNAVIKELDDGTYTEPSRLTVGAWLEIWLKDYTANIKASTRSDYAFKIRNHIIPVLGTIPLRKLNPHTVQGLYNKLLESGRIKQKCHKKEMPAGLSARTVNLIHTILQMALKQAVKLSYIRLNPTEVCTLPRVQKKEMTILQGDQIPAFIKAVHGHNHKALFLTLLFTGARSGEALGLTWECVDFHGGTLLIKKQLQRERVKGGKLHLVPLKNDKERRLSPPSALFNILSEHKRKQAEKQLRAGQLWEKSGLVFTNDIGGGLDGTAVYNAYKRMLKYNGLPKIRIHDLRHTAATLMLQNGDDYKTLQEALGHHSAGFTLDTYGHVTDRMRKDSADRMDAFIKGLSVSL